MKKCKCKSKCTCSADVYNMPANCTGYPSCADGETCSESFDGQCTIYTGDSLVDITVPNGANINEITQRLVGAITNPGCNYGNSPCSSVIVKSTKITTTNISLSWGELPGSPSYQIEYKLANAPSWTTTSPVTTLSGTIMGLATATTYWIRIATICSEQTCYSVTLSITTK